MLTLLRSPLALTQCMLPLCAQWLYERSTVMCQVLELMYRVNRLMPMTIIHSHYLAFLCFVVASLRVSSSRLCSDASHCSPLRLYQGQSGIQATMASTTPPPYTCARTMTIFNHKRIAWKCAHQLLFDT